MRVWALDELAIAFVLCCLVLEVGGLAAGPDVVE